LAMGLPYFALAEEICQYQSLSAYKNPLRYGYSSRKPSRYWNSLITSQKPHALLLLPPY
jgi:hypothetical protein